MNCEDINKLSEKKKDIEDKISEYKSVLDKYNVGMNESLTDEADFPRNDIDVITVLSARREINCLLNDHKAIMLQIEQRIHDHFQNGESRHTLEHDYHSVSANRSELNGTDSVMHDEAFAQVDQVLAGSPADIAGIQQGDLITKIGSFTANKLLTKDIKVISDIFLASKNSSLQVHLLRDKVNAVITFLVPRTWSGYGLTGLRLTLL
ncbi:hypothetical protein GJ496_011739 [Pomphorhynchus laevis]|nr:hypothetical protein GJ496_011739 [Pomphorhynchus laevis]